MSPERFKPTHVPALRRCSTTRARRGARVTVPLAVMLAPLATDAGTDRESDGDAAACAAQGQPTMVTASTASATEPTRIRYLRPYPCPCLDCSFARPYRQPGGCACAGCCVYRSPGVLTGYSETGIEKSSAVSTIRDCSAT